MSGIVPIGASPLFASEGARPVESATRLTTTEATTGNDGITGSFGSFLTEAVDQANRMDLAASEKVQALAAGATDDLHGTMISAKEAEISIKLVGTVRNKILDAFQELWRTSV